VTLSPSLDLDALYRRYAPGVLIYLRRFADQDTVPDLAADVWERVVKKQHLYRPTYGRFSTWLYMLARRRGLDYRRRECPPVTPVSLQRLPPDWPEPCTEDHASDPDLRAAAAAAIRHLRPDRRRAVYLRRYRDFTQQAAGAAMGRTGNAVNMLEQKAFPHLRRALAAWKDG
jgi:RNA polymerase sigma factor (sigma-70 family)